MPDDPIIPRPDRALGPGVERLVALRPAAQAFIDVGRYGNVFAGWRAQIARLIQRLAREVAASRLETATGAALRDLCASEFDTVLPVEPRAAVGDVMLLRNVDGGPGVIPKGTRFRRPAKADPLLPRTEASYVTPADVVVPQGPFHVPVPIVATRPGAFANMPTGLYSQSQQTFGTADLELGDKLFDKSFSVLTASAAGGTDGLNDDVLRAAARAYAVGRYAPTVGAVLAQALLHGAVHVAVIEDPVAAQSQVLALDASWATAPSWRVALQTAVNSEGFGLRAQVFDGTNTFVRVRASFALRRELNVTDTSPVTAAINTATAAYFTTRADWYSFRNGTLRAALSRAHRAIRACTSVAVIDAAPGGDPVREPTAALSPTAGAVHWALAPGAVEITYTDGSQNLSVKRR
jgi:hypothetical protein